MKLAILSPVYNAMPGASVASLVQLVQNCAKSNIEVDYRMIWRDSNVPHARLMLAEEALRIEADRILFLDDDIVFEPSHFGKLLSLDANDDIISGCYPHRNAAGGWIGTPTKDGSVQGPVMEMDHVGFGFMLLTRKCLTAMIATYGMSCFEFRKDESGEPRGDDQVFCESWRKLGGKIWAHTDVKLGHCGPHVFTG